ncbi:MAG: hypothetical protein AB9907_02600 [Flexilinea sp.]
MYIPDNPSLKVRLAGIVNESVSDGPGLRIAFFFKDVSIIAQVAITRRPGIFTVAPSMK